MFKGQIVPFDTGNLTIKILPSIQRNIQKRTRLNGPASEYFRHCEAFFEKVL